MEYNHADANALYSVRAVLRPGFTLATSMTPHAIRFQHVVKRHARSAVLAGVDLDIAQGECFGLVGVNGAGKTTLIKCLFDFCSIDAGSIDIFGVSHRLPQSRRRLAFLPEHFAPPCYLSGAGFLKYMLSLHGTAWDAAAVLLMLRALDLDTEALARTVRSYSKGMTQKLGLAACLLVNKDAYVLDEPMSGLDPKARALLKIQLQQLRARGSSVFFTSHALADVEQMCDRMAILHAGQIRFVGTPAQCCTRYSADSLEQAFMHCIAWGS